jgi:hypothetical protein
MKALGQRKLFIPRADKKRKTPRRSEVYDGYTLYLRYLHRRRACQPDSPTIRKSLLLNQPLTDNSR